MNDFKEFLVTFRFPLVAMGAMLLVQGFYLDALWVSVIAITGFISTLYVFIATPSTVSVPIVGLVLAIAALFFM